MPDVPSLALDEAVALVTGAGGGIGRAICAALSGAGARVVGTDLCDRPEDWSGATWFRQDVTSENDWADVMDQIGSRFGGLHCLVNNAGVALVETVAETSLAQWRRLMSVNAESVLLGLQASLPLLRESGKDRAGGSSVVNVSSVAGLRGSPLSAAYSASKGAVTLLTKSAAKEFAGFQYPIRVNSIHPGVVETPMIDSIVQRYVAVGFSASMAKAKEDFVMRTPMRRLALPRDIAGGVVFLCSSAAGFMTGTELVIDGGSLS